MDTELLSRAQDGDWEAFADLAAAVTPSFLSVAYRILRDADLAEDATQQSLLIIREWRRTTSEP
jgi:DNA-directed RNA polymerase specialized sigma24 family protein